jgi:hypothetical protein
MIAEITQLENHNKKLTDVVSKLAKGEFNLTGNSKNNVSGLSPTFIKTKESKDQTMINESSKNITALNKNLDKRFQLVK